MSSNEDDDDPGVCDYCDDIFLTKSGLAEHIREKHETPSKDSPKEEEEEEKPKRKMGPASRVKRARSSSDEEEEKVVKKVKMGPASRVKRDRSASPENSQPQKSVSPVRKDISRSASPAELDMNIDKLVEGLASTESEPEKKDEKPERSRSKEKGEESRSDKHKMKKKKKHKDRDRDREKERSREKDRGGESKKKHKDNKDRERPKENGEKSKHGDDRDKVRPKMGPASKVSRARSDSTSDDEESNRRRQEEAKARWQKKQDEAKGRLGKVDRGSADSRDFIASDDEGTKKMKGDRDLTLSDLIKAKKKSDHDKPNKHFSEKNDTPKKTAGFPGKGTVAAHDNDSGPECSKCGQVCKDNSNLKNHVLSHYYQVFYNVLPDCKPFACPICGNPSRDKITMVRHYAFTHKKFFELTDVTPEDLQGFGTRSRAPGTGKTPAKKKEKIDSRLLNDSSDDEGDKKVGSFTDKNMERLKEKYKEADEKRHKEHKHKDHKHKKEKKHKKDKKHKKEKHRDRDKDRDRDGKDMSNPLSSLLKEMTPDSSSSEPVKAKVGENGGNDGYRPTLAPTQRVAHVPSTAYQQSDPLSYESSKTQDLIHSPVEEQRHPEQSQDAEESDDEFDMDLPAPVFA